MRLTSKRQCLKTATWLYHLDSIASELESVEKWHVDLIAALAANPRAAQISILVSAWKLARLLTDVTLHFLATLALLVIRHSWNI